MVGLAPLVRLAWRRDRLDLAIWIALLGALPASGYRAYETFYPSAAERAGLTGAIRANPAVAVIYGPAFDLSTAGGFTAWRFGGVLSAVAGLMAIFTVTRHTRGDEESGRAELLAAGVVGRYAFLGAAVVVAGTACLLVGAVQALVLSALGAPVAGAVCFGLSTAGAGLVFTGVAAVTAQVASFSRSANGSAAAVLGLAFLLRAIGDSTASGGRLSWLSPIGWAQQSRPFAAERWWVLVLPLVTTGALVGLAGVLAGHRDLGRGLAPSRRSPAHAGPRLSGPAGLGWRLQRASAIGWLVALAIAGAMLGSIASGIGDLVGDSEQTQEIFERMGGSRGLVQAYLATICGLFGTLAAFVTVQSVVHLRREEAEGRAEPVLATAVRRDAWAGGHLAVGLVAGALAVLVAGLAAGVAHGLRTDDVAAATGDLVAGAAVQLPAVALVAALAVAALGWRPRAAVGAAWGIAGSALALALFGPALDLPQWVLDVSPFTHVPKLPGAEVDALPLVVMSALAVAVGAVGFAGLRRRDIG